MATKLVVFGLPWDVDSEGLRKHMAKFGPLEDCIVMKDRLSGRSRGFGYVTFSSADDVKNVLEFKHFLRNRALEVRIATPREEMKPQPQGTKTATRIFVGRIPQSADELMFRRHFEAFGEIIDLYMPKVTVNIAAPPRGDSSGGFADPMPGVDLHASPYGSMRPFGMFCSNLGYNQGYGPSGGTSRSRTDGRHRPY